VVVTGAGVIGSSSRARPSVVVVVVVVVVVALVQGVGFGGIVGMKIEMPFGQLKPSFHSNFADGPAFLKVTVLFRVLIEPMSTW